jgi:hypothetical protein
VSVEFAPSLGCRALKDALLYVSFLLSLAGLVTACLRAIDWMARSFSDRGPVSGKHRTFSKGANG